MVLGSTPGNAGHERHLTRWSQILRLADTQEESRVGPIPLCFMGRKATSSRMMMRPATEKIKIDIHDNVSIPITTNSMYIEVVFKISLLKTL